MSPTQMESCMETVVNIFHQYSVRQDHFDKLSKKEMSQLVHKQFPNWLKEQKNPKAIEELFKQLDQDQDNQLSFGEFMVFICKLTIATHEHIHQEGDDGHAHHQH
ncbi:protein S100-A12 [Anolis carolinensis]|nr:PREDICTED: protein S100-A12 [Anolis carolinensis]XP_060614513.1 protein S100-A12-like [Anolis sagrei ordinatus]|eukprot:XP_003229667.1 PREDICTED: protein S100-A12 [Anolis carolinensis]